MDLWIRSQDRKKLVLNPNLYIITTENDYSCITESLVGYLGIYKDDKRALEVLDEIQMILKGKNFIKLKSNLSPFSVNQLKKEFRTN